MKGLVLPDVVVREGLVELLEVRVVDVFEDEGRSSGDRILYHAVKGYHVCSSPQVFQNLNFSLNFLLFDRFQCFNDAFVVGGDIYTLEDFTVLAPTQLPH